MAALNVPSRTLFIADNLAILRGINSESVDLIATDPPFNKGVKAFQGITKAGDSVSYSDIWTWGDVQAEWSNEILANHPALYSVIQAANAAAGDDMGAFLCWLAVRVLECHRILKPTGSMYLHIDHTAHTYVKAMMDSIFGRDNFRNEIVWSYRTGGASKRNFARKHDTILFYRKSGQAVFHQQREKAYTKSKNRRAGIVNYGGAAAEFFEDDIGVYNWVNMRDVWEISYIGSTDSERTGYPTQKPIALYERIIKASSNEGDIVLDPFAGCATTCVAAEQSRRQWIGIDINEEATNVIRDRLQSEVTGSLAWATLVQTPTEAPERTDGGDPAAPELRIVSRTRNARRWSVREVRETLLGENGQRCQGCGWEPPYPDYLQIDHKKPRSLGGADEMDNYTLLCDPCNRLKSNKLTLNELRDLRVKESRIDALWWAEERWR